MNEFEIATIAFQDASLALRGETLTVARWQIAATLAIGLGQIAIVWYGIRAMQRAGDRRAKEQDQRHDETMLALRELIDGQRDDRQALRELIARTGRAEPA